MKVVHSLSLQRLMIALVVCGCIGCDFYKDPDNTLKRVSGGTLRVGLTENKPWVIRADDEAHGVEVELVRQFAAELNSKLVWVWGNEHEIMDALQYLELDMVIGGITEKSMWKKKVGFTRPFLTERLMVGVPPEMPPISHMSGVGTAAKIGTVAGYYLEKAHAKAIRVENPFDMGIPVAAYEWEFEKRGFIRTSTKLQEEGHIMAVPPGENRFLGKLEEFLESRRSMVKSLIE